MNVRMHGNIRLAMEVPKQLRKSNGHSKSLHLFVFIRVIRGRICICIFSGSKRDRKRARACVVRLCGGWTDFLNWCVEQIRRPLRLNEHAG